MVCSFALVQTLSVTNVMDMVLCVNLVGVGIFLWNVSVLDMKKSEAQKIVDDFNKLSTKQKKQVLMDRIIECFVETERSPCYSKMEGDCMYARKGHVGCAVGCQPVFRACAQLDKFGLYDLVASISVICMSYETVNKVFGPNSNIQSFTKDLQNWHDEGQYFRDSIPVNKNKARVDWLEELMKLILKHNLRGITKVRQEIKRIK